MPGADRDDDSGKYRTTRDAGELLAVMEPGEPYTASELAEAVEWPYRTAHHVLTQLAEDGQVRKKKPGARTVIWVRQ